MSHRRPHPEEGVRFSIDERLALLTGSCTSVILSAFLFPIIPEVAFILFVVGVWKASACTQL